MTSTSEETLSRVLRGAIGLLWVITGFGFNAMVAVLWSLNLDIREGLGVSPFVLLALGVLALLFPVTMFLKGSAPAFLIAGHAALGVFGIASGIIDMLVVRLPHFPA